jgi:hypothetical protein
MFFVKGMKNVLELRLVCEEVTTSNFIPYYLFFHSYFEHYINSSNFTLKKLCTWDEPIKRLNPKQKTKLCSIFKYLLPQPTYI